MNKYDLNRLDEWVFYVNVPFTIPYEHISYNDDLTLETGDYFEIHRFGYSIRDKDRYDIHIINKNERIGFTVNSTIHSILHNSDLNKSHKSPFFSECKKIYERDKTIDCILEKN